MNMERINGDFPLQMVYDFQVPVVSFSKGKKILEFLWVFLRGISRVFLNAPRKPSTFARYYEAQLPKSKSRLGFRDLRQVLKVVGVLFSWVESACDFCGFDFF